MAYTPYRIIVVGLAAAVVWALGVRLWRFVVTTPKKMHVEYLNNLKTLETKNQVYRDGQKGLQNDIAKRDATIADLRREVKELRERYEAVKNGR